MLLLLRLRSLVSGTCLQEAHSKALVRNVSLKATDGPRRLIFSMYQQILQSYVRFEVFTAVTMKNVVFWDIRTQFVLHRRHITSPLHSPDS
jgi:hypothetical protein